MVVSTTSWMVAMAAAVVRMIPSSHTSPVAPGAVAHQADDTGDGEERVTAEPTARRAGRPRRPRRGWGTRGAEAVADPPGGEGAGDERPAESGVGPPCARPGGDHDGGECHEVGGVGGGGGDEVPPADVDPERGRTSGEDDEEPSPAVSHGGRFGPHWAPADGTSVPMGALPVGGRAPARWSGPWLRALPSGLGGDGGDPLGQLLHGLAHLVGVRGGRGHDQAADAEVLELLDPVERAPP